MCCCEFSPAFAVVWILTEWVMPPQQRVRLRESIPPGSLPKERTEPMRAWATTILEWHPPQESGANALWDSYMDIAEFALAP